MASKFPGLPNDTRGNHAINWGDTQYDQGLAPQKRWAYRQRRRAAERVLQPRAGAGHALPEVNTFAYAFAGSRSRHPGGVSVLLGDGSVRFVKNTIKPVTWIALGSISGGEVVSADSF